MLHDIIHSLVVVTCHYTTGNLFFKNGRLCGLNAVTSLDTLE